MTLNIINTPCIFLGFILPSGINPAGIKEMDYEDKFLFYELDLEVKPSANADWKVKDDIIQLSLKEEIKYLPKEMKIPFSEIRCYSIDEEGLFVRFFKRGALYAHYKNEMRGHH